MRVLTIVSAKIWGGGEQYIYDLSEAMTAEGDASYIVVSSCSKEIQSIYEKVATVLPAKLHRIKGFTEINKIRDYIIQNKIDTIICQSGRDILLCVFLRKMTGAKLIFIKHNVGKSKQDIYHQWIQKQMDAIICVSRLVYNVQKEYILDKKKIHLVYNGINPSRFLMQNSENKKNNIFTIGYAGRLVENKGVFHLIQAVESLHKKGVNFQCYIVGDGEAAYKSFLTEYIELHGLKDCIKIQPFTENIAEFYRGLDLLVAPSITAEAFGLVLCEAMYMGIPVLTTNSGAQEEIINDGVDGFIVRNMTVESLAEKIHEIKKDCILRECVAKQGKEKVEEQFLINHTWHNLKEVISTYKECE